MKPCITVHSHCCVNLKSKIPQKMQHLIIKTLLTSDISLTLLHSILQSSMQL
jgi:hypothetical protein